MALIFLAEITAVIDGAGTTSVFRFGSVGYNHPTAPGYYEERIVQPANLQRTIFDQDRVIGGSSTVSFGDLVLVNADGALDVWLADDYGFDGQPLRILVADDDAGTPAYSAFTVLLSGTMEQVAPTYDTATGGQMVVKIRDRQELLNVPIQSTKYAGDNVLPDGVEGVADDLLGKPKVLCFGSAENVPAPLVNTSALVYQVHDSQINDITAVYDKGVPLTKDASRASLAALMSTATAAGHFDYYLGSGADGAYFKLGSTPAGDVTADVQGDKAGGTYRTSIADICAQIVQSRPAAGPVLTGADITAGDITALNAKAPGAVGIWIDAETTIKDALDQITASGGVWWGFDRLGNFRLIRLEAPAAVPVWTFARFGPDVATGDGMSDIAELSRAVPQDPGRGVPAGLIKLNYRRCWQTQSGSALAGAVLDRANFVKDQWRQTMSPAIGTADPTVTARHKLAKQLDPFNSLLVNQADAQALADWLQALFKVRRDLFTIKTKLTQGLVAAVDLGKTVQVKLPRFGFDAGKNFVVIGLTYDCAAMAIQLDLWG